MSHTYTVAYSGLLSERHLMLIGDLLVCWVFVQAFVWLCHMQISGREMFEFNPDLIEGDDDEADDEVDFEHGGTHGDEVGTNVAVWLLLFAVQRRCVCARLVTQSIV